MTNCSRVSAEQLQKNRSFGYSTVSHAAILAFIAGVACIGFLGVSFFGAVKGVPQPAVLAGFAINTCLGLPAYIVSLKKAPISFSQIHWVFYLTFFCLAPLSQYLNAYSCWGYALSDSDYTNTNFIVLVWGAFVFAFSSLKGKKEDAADESVDDLIDCAPCIRTSRMLILLGLGAVATYLVVSVYGFGNIFSRSTMDSNLPLTLDLVFGKVIRPLPIFVLAFCIVYFRQQKKRRSSPRLFLFFAYFFLYWLIFLQLWHVITLLVFMEALLSWQCLPLEKIRGFFLSCFWCCFSSFSRQLICLRRVSLM